MRERVTEKDMGTRGCADVGQRGRGERRRADTGTRGQKELQEQGSSRSKKKQRGRGERRRADTGTRGERELQEQGRGTNAPRNYFPSAPGHLRTWTPLHRTPPHPNFLTSLTPHSSLTEAIDEVDSQADKVRDAQFVEL